MNCARAGRRSSCRSPLRRRLSRSSIASGGARPRKPSPLGAALLSFAACIALLAFVVANNGTTVALVWRLASGQRRRLSASHSPSIPQASAVADARLCAVVIGALVFSREYFDEVGTIFYVLILAMLGAMIAFAYAADAFDLFVFYEVFSVAAYALCGVSHRNERSVRRRAAVRADQYGRGTVHTGRHLAAGGANGRTQPRRDRPFARGATR